MENQHFLDESDLIVENERPTFLTVLCIITFIVSGFISIYTIFSALTYSEEQQIASGELAIENMIEIAEQQGATDSLDSTITAMEVFNTENIENAILLMILSILASLLSVLGAIFMYRLRKIGFHIYLVSKIISAFPLVIFTLSFPVFLTYGILSFFTLAFIVMYGINVKHMK